MQSRAGMARRLGLGAAAALMSLSIASSARAGTYTIYDCPSAPIPNDNAGPWSVYGGPKSDKTSCALGLGDFIGPLGGEMSPNSGDGVSISAPSGLALVSSEIYWYDPQSISGAHTYAVVFANGSLIGQAFNPTDHRYTPEIDTLPAGTTSLVLQTNCSNDDAQTPCKLGNGEETPDLQLFGSAITVSDPTAPTGGLTGGGLDGNGPASGTQSISYTANDSLAGVDSVQLLVDGEVVATNSYAGSCSFTNFQPCPASEPGSLVGYRGGSKRRARDRAPDLKCRWRHHYRRRPCHYNQQQPKLCLSAGDIRIARCWTDAEKQARAGQLRPSRRQPQNQRPVASLRRERGQLQRDRQRHRDLL